MADVDMFEVIHDLNGAFITVHQERCAMVRNRNAECLRCALSCTSGCISFDDGVLSVSPEKCIGCGTCATVCPTCALEAHHPNDAELFNACTEQLSRRDGQVSIACARVCDESCVRVECLGRVEESLLTTLKAQGAARVILKHGNCALCEHKSGWDTFCAVLETENTLLKAWDSELAIDVVAELDCAPGASSAGERKQPESDDAHSAEPFVREKVMKDGTLPHFLPDRRERLLDALADLGEPVEEQVETRLWGDVSIDVDACMGCRMCATFCPTGALSKFDEPEGEAGMLYCAADCVKCRTCLRICPAGAISVSDFASTAKLMSGETARFPMELPAIKRGQAHTIWKLAETMTKTTQVYER